ncbi:hypothetical protein L3X38_014279 [Prunus dulcis]|uniref:Uncharacterized protein n=1 Tax=Prunus dulcis TaxID=3755 RepID=A0AAD4WMW4_PRUDU|nr:hypothetical protein L3X38_014279 [Prunus dulcis]
MWESNEPTEYGVGGVFDDLIQSSITNEALSICESNIRRSGPVALIIHYNFYMIMLPRSHARKGRTPSVPRFEKSSLTLRLHARI